MWLIGFFAAVIMGAVLSTFNSVLNSVATLFSMDIYKKHIAKNVSDTKLVKIGKVRAQRNIFYSYRIHFIGWLLYEKSLGDGS